MDRTDPDPQHCMKVEVTQHHAKKKQKCKRGPVQIAAGQNCLSMIMHKNGSLLHCMHELLKKRKCHDGFCSVHHFCKIIVSKIHRCCCVRARFEKNTKRI
jgi:hypothetical protein